MTEEDIKEALLEHAVRNGVITFDELYDAFPPEYCNLDHFWDLLTLLEDLGVRVVETAEYMKPKRRIRRAA